MSAEPHNLLYAAGKRALDIGIFCAIHTYGRRLNWHPHVHVSVTCGGIDKGLYAGTAEISVPPEFWRSAVCT